LKTTENSLQCFGSSLLPRSIVLSSMQHSCTDTYAGTILKSMFWNKKKLFGLYTSTGKHMTYVKVNGHYYFVFCGVFFGGFFGGFVLFWFFTHHLTIPASGTFSRVRLNNINVSFIFLLFNLQQTIPSRYCMETST